MYNELTVQSWVVINMGGRRGRFGESMDVYVVIGVRTLCGKTATTEVAFAAHISMLSMGSSEARGMRRVCGRDEVAESLTDLSARRTLGLSGSRRRAAKIDASSLQRPLPHQWLAVGDASATAPRLSHPQKEMAHTVVSQSAILSSLRTGHRPTVASSQ